MSKNPENIIRRYEKAATQWPTCAEIDSMKWPVGGLRVELRPATSSVRSEDDVLAPPTDQCAPDGCPAPFAGAGCWKRETRKEGVPGCPRHSTRK